MNKLKQQEIKKINLRFELNSSKYLNEKKNLLKSCLKKNIYLDKKYFSKESILSKIYLSIEKFLKKYFEKQILKQRKQCFKNTFWREDEKNRFREKKEDVKNIIEKMRLVKDYGE